MARQVHYNSAEKIAPATAADPYLRPSFPLGDRIKRQIWDICWLLFYRTSPRPFHGWRAMWLRIFGAKMGPNCHFYPKSKIWAPWNLICADQVTAGDDAEIYNPAPMNFGSHAIVSQGAYLCGATHDYDDPAFPLIAYTMEIGAYSWICAHAKVGPGANVGEGAILGLGAVTTKDLEPWGVYSGSPAVKVKDRKHE